MILPSYWYMIWWSTYLRRCRVAIRRRRLSWRNVHRFRCPGCADCSGSAMKAAPLGTPLCRRLHRRLRRRRRLHRRRRRPADSAHSDLPARCHFAPRDSGRTGIYLRRNVSTMSDFGFAEQYLTMRVNHANRRYGLLRCVNGQLRGKKKFRIACQRK